jgi:hypothetical protein
MEKLLSCKDSIKVPTLKTEDKSSYLQIRDIKALSCIKIASKAFVSKACISKVHILKACASESLAFKSGG